MCKHKIKVHLFSMLSVVMGNILKLCEGIFYVKEYFSDGFS